MGHPSASTLFHPALLDPGFRVYGRAKSCFVVGLEKRLWEQLEHCFYSRKGAREMVEVLVASICKVQKAKVGAACTGQTTR